MKTNKIKIFFSIIAFSFLVTSCQNLLSELTQQKTYIQISTNLDNTNQRTVLPDFSVVKENGYTWELYCDSKILQTWNDDNGKSAYENMCESKIEVDPGSYSFELVIKKDIISNNNEIKSVTLLKGTISDCTISEGSNNLSFIMNPLPVTEGTGTINFTLNLPYDSTVTSADAELSLYGIEDKNFITENFESIENSSISVTFPTSQINSGTYLLKIYLYNNGNVTSVVNVYYTIVVIYPGECSTETVTLTQLTKYYNVTTHYIDAKTNEEIETTSVYYKKDSVFTLPEVSRDDYSFGGYYNDPNFTTPINTITINQDKDIYVKYIKDLAYVDPVLEIYTERGLNTFRNIVNNSFRGIIKVGNTDFSSGNSSNQSLNAKLCSDIVLSDGSEWVPIGNSDHFYQGTFDGDGKCVKGLKITTNYSTELGFFGCVQDATIMDLYVQGNIEATNDSEGAVGGIVGYAKSMDGKSVTISNCINNVQINSQSEYVGGILGNFYSGSGEINIDSCVNIANLTAPYPSGILTTTGNSTIKNCLNLGNLTRSSTSTNYSAGICMTYNVNCTVSNCINTGSIIPDEQCYPILCYSNNTDGSNPTCSNCFYDSDKIQNVPENSFGSGKITSWFYTEDTNSEENLSVWSFAFGRYPLPSTLQSIFDDGNSYDDVWAKLCKAAETGITTWSALASAIEDETSTQSEFVITNNLVATETIEISRPIKIIGGEVTITRGDNFKNEFFNVAESNSQSASLTIQGSDNKNIIFDSFNKTASAPFINFSKELTVSNCTFQNNTNSETDGGAIYSKGNFSATNCTFINNHTNGSNMSGGAIAVYDDATVNIKKCTLKNNSSNCQNGGGALYIQKNNSSNFVNIINSSFENNGANAIYVHKGSLSLSSVTMEENTTTINGESTTRDIYVYDIQSNGALEFDGVNSEILMILCFGTGNNVNAKKIAVGTSFSMAESKKITVEFSGTTSNNFSIAADKPYFSFDDDIYIEELVNTVNENFIFRYQNTTYTLTAEGELTSSE